MGSPAQYTHSSKNRPRALVFDLSFYANYRFSQVRRLFKQTAMRNVFSKTELDDIVEEAYFKQNGRSYPTFN